MKKNDFPTNPVAFAQYVWENIEDGDTLMDKLQNIWEVSSYTIFDGRKIEINLCCVDSSKWAGGYYNGKHEKLTRYDLASKYYLYIDDEQVKIPAVEDWTVSTFVQNYNTIWSILDTMHSPTTSPTKEEKEDIHKLLLLTQEADKKYEGKIEQLSTLRTLDGLKNKIEKETEKCLPKEDKQMAENEKNYFPKNKGKTGADTQLKSAFYSNEEFCTRLVDTLLSTLGGTICACEKIKKFMESCYEENKTSENKIPENKTASSKNKTTYLKSSPNLNDKTKGNEITPPTLSNQKMEKIYKENIYKEKFDNFPYLDKYVNNKDEVNTISDNDVDFVNRPFHIGDIVVLVNGEIGYISKISHRNNIYYYYYTPIVIIPASDSAKTTRTKVVRGLETKLNPTLEFYLRIGDWDLTSDLMRASLHKYKEFKDLALNYVHVNDEKDSNTSTPNDTAPNDTAPSDTAPSSSRENLIISSLPNYLRKLNLIDSTYNYEVNTKLTTDTAEKLNDVIEALNDVIRYLQDNK